MKFDERNLLNPPFFVSMATAAKFVQPIPIFWGYLVPLDVDVTGHITANICEVWSEFNILCTLVTMVTIAISTSSGTRLAKQKRNRLDKR
jgi:hypothetical protein